MLGECFSVHEGKQKNPVERFVSKFYLLFFLMGGMRLMLFSKESRLGCRKKEEKRNLNSQKINTRVLAISL